MYENYVELNNNIVKICDCFTAPEDAEDIRVGEEISRIVRRAFLYRFMSYVTDDCENKGMDEKEMLERVGHHVPKDARWQHFVQACKDRNFDMEELKAAVKHIGDEVKGLFDDLSAGELDKDNCTLYAEGKSFADVILAVDKLPFEYHSRTDFNDDDELVQYLVINESNRRQGYAYVEIEEFIPKYYKSYEPGSYLVYPSRPLEFTIMNAKEMKKGETSLEGDAVRKKKDILFNMFSLYAQRYILLDIWKEDAKESDSSKELLEKAQKLFAYSESEDDPRDKRAQEIYTDISDYLENQPMEFWETVDCRRGKLEDLLCEAYDKVYGK